MAKRKKSESTSQSEKAEETVRNGRATISEYEEQRLRRIAENQARLKAMGLPQMVSSLKNLPQIKNKKGKEKEKVEDDDEEYRPENEEERETESDSSSEHDSEFENASGSRKMKAKNKSLKNKSLKVKSRVTGKKHGDNLDYVGDEDEALMQSNQS